MELLLRLLAGTGRCLLGCLLMPAARNAGAGTDSNSWLMLLAPPDAGFSCWCLLLSTFDCC